ncbi:MAG: peptide chain release factor 2 [Chloroflexota bacterium]|nr:peptide chain release factor 2 [Chloroflexota bacterium]MDE2961730.1 peptide chain release factor 2 [Chloroflexota bacterium]
MEELRQQLEDMSTKLDAVMERLDLTAREESIAELEKEASAPGFWDDAAAAQRKMQELGKLQHSVELWNGLRSQVADLLELTSLAIESDDESVAGELTVETAATAANLAKAEMELTLSGPYDDRPAILTIHSGAGGTDSHDWVEMLTGMYSSWATLGSRPVQVLNTAYGDEAGLRTSTLEIGGQHAFGYLNAEVGVHRLVRISPFDPARRRQTSFARVEVLPAADDDDSEVELRSDDLKMDFFRSSGPGGQNVQKVASAVRLTHVPTGIVVSCQTERSQHQNRDYAMRILRAKLLALREDERAQELSALRGERVSAEWGNQIRSYVLHPYKSVKDHRTDHQMGNADAVLAGDIDGFIEAWLVSRLGGD